MLELLKHSSLPALRVKKRQLLNETAVMLLLPDTAIPDKGPLRKQLNGFLGDVPFYHFSKDQIAIWVLENGEYIDSDQPVKLTDIDAFQDINKFCDDLVDSFQDLPYEYHFCFQFPKHLSERFLQLENEFKFSENMLVGRIAEEFCKKFPINHVDEKRQERIHRGTSLFDLSIGGKKEKEWDKESWCLQFKTEGYVDQYGSTPTALEAMDIVKSFFGLGIASGLYRHKMNNTQNVSSYSIIHRKIDNMWTVDGKYYLDDRTKQILSDLEFTNFENDPEFEKWTKLAIPTLNQIGLVFQFPEFSERLLLAAKWHFESFARQDEALGFLNSVIVLEVLLGEKADSSELGIGALLRNRAAFMIGQSVNDRKQVMENIREIYDLRSQIVHSGKHRFSIKDRVLGTRLRKICERIIWHEIELLAKSPKTK